MRKIRKSKPPEQAIEQYTLYHTVVYTCPYCSAQLGGGLRRAGGRRSARMNGVYGCWMVGCVRLNVV